MKKSFTKNLKPVIVLSLICLVVAAVMGGINMITAPEIENQLKIAANAAKAEVLPNADPASFSDNMLAELVAGLEDKDSFPTEITAIYKADAGYVFQASVSGNEGGLIIMCGVDNNGKIAGVTDVSNNETSSFWAKVLHLVGGKDSAYVGSDYSGVKPDLVSGATKSSTGIYNAVKAAAKAYGLICGESADDGVEEEPIAPEDTTTPKVDRTEEERLALAKEMYDGDVTLESLYIYNPDPTTIGVYKNAEDNTYVFHIATRTQYVALETEAMILVDATGKVIKVDLLNWTVGHGVNYTPDYLNSFIGKNKYFTDDVELVTEATVTSQNLVTALKNALFDVFGSICATDEEIDVLCYKAIPRGETLTKMDLPENAPATVKKMYKLDSGRGYVFFVSTSTDLAPYETEAFVYVDINGKLMDAYICGWVVGHNIYPDDSYIEGLKGKTKEQLGNENGDLVDHVAAATGTSVHLEHAIADAMSVVPEHVNYSVIAIIVIAAAIVCAAGIAVYSKLRRRRANEK